MLARLHIFLPYSLILPDGENYSIYSYEDDGYEIRVFPPGKSNEVIQGVVNGEKLTINDKLGFRVNVLKIDFIKASFDRQVGIDGDPSLDLIERTVNLFLRKLRFVARGFQIKEIDLKRVSWHLRYLNEDETELERMEGKVRGRGARSLTFSWIALTPEIWNNIHSFPDNYSPPEWDSLYLDALDALPNIGLSIVLAVTALEVFISRTLDSLAAKSTTPSALWEWINNRGREPNLIEQYDELLRILLGISLKENSILWEAFRNVKTARNAFVHQGIAQVGGKTINEDEAKKLVHQTAEIISFIKNKLSEDLRWPEFEHKTRVEVVMPILGENQESKSA